MSNDSRSDYFRQVNSDPDSECQILSLGDAPGVALYRSKLANGPADSLTIHALSRLDGDGEPVSLAVGRGSEWGAGDYRDAPLVSIRSGLPLEEDHRTTLRGWGHLDGEAVVVTGGAAIPVAAWDAALRWAAGQ